MYCSLFNYVFVPQPLLFYNPVARYSEFVLKMTLNAYQPTNFTGARGSNFGRMPLLPPPTTPVGTGRR